MNCLRKFVWLTLALYTKLAYTLSKHTSAGSLLQKLQSVDLLQIAILKPLLEITNSIVYFNSSSLIYNKKQNSFSFLNISKTSESHRNEHERINLFKFPELTYANFNELKFTIDDYGNISYLDQDF